MTSENIARQEIGYKIARAKSRREIDELNGYAKALYDYDHITYSELEDIRGLLNKRQANGRE